jgi:hypothetical protein
VVQAINITFSKFTELGSVRKVWNWFRTEKLLFPTRAHLNAEIRWAAPTYTCVRNVLTNPVYAGAYCYGKVRYERYVDEEGTVRKRSRQLPIGTVPLREGKTVGFSSS